jgi:DNA-binding transcriptional LysR family regulator
LIPASRSGQHFAPVVIPGPHSPGQPEGGSGTRDTLAAALAAALGPGAAQAHLALSVSTTAAGRSAVLAGAAPAVISELAVADDLAAGRLVEIQTPELDLRRTLRVIWNDTANPPAGAARDLVAHILSRRRPPRGSPSPAHGHDAQRGGA